jgi:WD40 repeat protein
MQGLRFDRVLIDPTPDALGETLAAANKGYRVGLLRWPPKDFTAFVSKWRSAAEGRRQWKGKGSVAVAWWSDPLGRKHCRVVGAAGADDLFQPDTDAYREGRERPYLWLVYPDDLYPREQSGIELWAGCRCGASGPPERLGWMGPWCAACHDRAEEGAPQTRPGLCRPVVFSGHPFWVGDVVFLPDGRTLLVRVDCYPSVWVWDTVTGRVAQRTFPGKPKNAYAYALTVSADGRRAAISIDGRVYLWSPVDDADGPTLSPSSDSRAGRVALAFSPDGTLLASASADWGDGRILVHESTTGRLLRTLVLDSSLYHMTERCLAFSPDGRTLALAVDEEPMVRRWDVESGEELPALPGGSDDGGDVVAYSPDGKTLAAGYSQPADGFLQLWDAVSGADRGTFKEGPVTCLAFSPDSRLLATVGDDACLRLRNAADGRLLATFRWHQADIDTVAFSPDGRWLATGGKEERVKLWPVDALLGRGRRPAPRRKSQKR